MRKRKHVGMHPVERALIMRDLKSTHTRISVQMLMTQHGEPSADLLSEVAYCIGVVAQTMVQVVDYHSTPWLRQLHGALRQIQSLCLHNDYRWDGDVALALQRALEVANEHLPQALSHQALAFAGMLEARKLRETILTKQLKPDAIVDINEVQIKT
jgi:hypothetical protein